MRSLQVALVGLLFAVSGASAASALRDSELVAFESCSTPEQQAVETSWGPYRGIGIGTLLGTDTVETDRGVVWFKVTLAPNLLDGHVLTVAYDGKLLPRVDAALEFSLASVAHGRHTIQAHVVDPDGNTLISSQPVEFFARDPQ